MLNPLKKVQTNQIMLVPYYKIYQFWDPWTSWRHHRIGATGPWAHGPQATFLMAKWSRRIDHGNKHATSTRSLVGGLRNDPLFLGSPEAKIHWFRFIHFGGLFRSVDAWQNTDIWWNMILYTVYIILYYILLYYIIIYYFILLYIILY